MTNWYEIPDQVGDDVGLEEAADEAVVGDVDV